MAAEPARDLVERSLLEDLVTDIAALDPRPKAAALAAVDRISQRDPRYEVSIVADDEDRLALAPSPHVGGPDADIVRRLDAFGTTSAEFAAEMVGRLASIARQPGEAVPSQQALNAALAAVDSVRPENETEALLAVQMYATHETAMQMLTKAKMSSGDPASVQRSGDLAVKLLRTYTAQIEALAKIRRRGEQRVVVEHVHVHPGAQAVVGNVTTNIPLPGVPSDKP